MSNIDDIQLEEKTIDGLSHKEREEQDKIHQERKNTYNTLMSRIQNYFFIPVSYGFSVAIGLSFGYSFYDWLSSKLSRK